jgi:hypothetical protein
MLSPSNSSVWFQVSPFPSRRLKLLLIIRIETNNAVCRISVFGRSLPGLIRGACPPYFD